MIDQIENTIARRVYGPFNAKDIPGNSERGRISTAARYYLYLRKRRKVKPQEAMRLACLTALTPYSRRTPQYYDSSDCVGKVWNPKDDSTSYRWASNTDAIGLRFLGYVDELEYGPDHKGWYNRDDDYYSTLRGCIYLLPGKGGKTRMIPAYKEMEGGKEMNPGSACLAVSEVTSERADSSYDAGDLPHRSGALAIAESIAENRAESEREYDEAYQQGAKAGESIAESEEMRKDALELLKEIKQERRAGNETARPVICAALRDKLDSMLKAIKRARQERDSSFAEVTSSQEEAWRYGFADTAGNEALRAVA